MMLPELDLQIVYGKLSWGLVLAAALTSLARQRWTVRAKGVFVLAALSMAWQLLPGAASPAYWLTLAFQLPSAMLAALSVAILYQQCRDVDAAGVLDLPFAGVVAVLGILLYLDTMGLLALGMYPWGFSSVGAPVVAAALTLFCVYLLVWRRILSPTAVALLAAIALFSIFRLPSGNFWDAMLDPLLWLWSLALLQRRLFVRRPRLVLVHKAQ